MNSSSVAVQSTTSSTVLVRVFFLGLYFGVVLIKSEVATWERIHKMFLFQEAYMYLVLSTALVVGITTMFLFKRAGFRTVDGEKIKSTPKPFHKGVILGGMLFGMGWAITGACPGPIYAQIGAGTWQAVITFLFAFAGMYLYAYLKPRLPH